MFEAILQNDSKKVKDLLWGKIVYGHKIDPNARAVLNNVKTTPLCLAAGRGFEDIVAILLEHGAQVNFATAEGMTPLHFAVSHHQHATAALLIKNGASTDTSDNLGVTPASMAKHIKDQQMVDIVVYRMQPEAEKKKVLTPDLDLKIAKNVVIGKQVWMTANLNVDHYRNGDPIPEVHDPKEWTGLHTGAWCYYNNDPANGAAYGKLYNWYAVNDQRGLAPEGWHVPSDTEWEALVQCLGGSAVAGGKMKERRTTHWNSPNTGATNESGFSALPGGDRYNFNGNYSDMGDYANFWSSTESSNNFAWSRLLIYGFSGVGRANRSSKRLGFSVRCIKD